MRGVISAVQAGVKQLSSVRSTARALGDAVGLWM